MIGKTIGHLTILCAIVSTGCFVSAAHAEKERKPFGVSKFTIQTTHTVERSEAGARIYENVPYAFTQAGGHPLDLTTVLAFDGEQVEGIGKEKYEVPTADPKDVVVDLPPGLLGDPMAVPRCSLTLLLGGERKMCPADTQVGVARVRWFGGVKEILGPIVNVVPEAGQSAEFALENTQKIPFLETGRLVRTANGTCGTLLEPSRGCYGFAVSANNIPTGEPIEIEQTFWGVPADPSHNPMRGLFCAKLTAAYPLCPEPKGGPNEGGEASGVEPVPFLTWMTDCAAGPEFATLRADSWENPGTVGLNQEYIGYTGALPVEFASATGCNLLKFEPSLEIKPDTLLADEPVGLTVKLKVPLNEEPGTNATPQLRDSAVTLPEGMSISPGAVDGIAACEEHGPHGIDITGPESEVTGSNGELRLAAGHCPSASTVGTAEAITPFLPVPVKGHVYLAKPGCGGVGQEPCTEKDALDGNLYKLYLELGGSGELENTGVHFKVPGYVEANPATGQLTTKFLDTVQAPFSELKIELAGGPRASLANPAVCGAASASADFTPWSAPGTTPQGNQVAGTADATPSSPPFIVLGCTVPTAFAPGFVAGTVTSQAGQLSPFTLDLSRKDREQYVKGIQVHTPPGLLGMLSSVPLCEEPAADAGDCPEAAKIGTTRVASGAGAHPFEIEGEVYLTGPYRGAPFGLSIVTHAVAGPFNLGLVVVRATIRVNPENSTLTITTDESGPYAVPQDIFGVPLRLQRVTTNIDRPNFMFNPTNCGPLQVSATISGSQDGKAIVTSPFAVGGCKSLAFKPQFTALTSGHTSRKLGASLDVRLSYPHNAIGSDSNVARVKVDLPRNLPSRLTTLQKACRAATFASNPAACPAASIVGTVKSTTPVLPVPLSGPVYFVSHGGEAFPSLIVVLQGDNVRVDLTGTTFINKAGITSSTFRSVPDVPVNTFELYLPEGEYSALAATGKLCQEKAQLVMPTEFVAQNGAVMRQKTKIAVTGCTTRKAKLARASRARKQSRDRRATK